MIASFYDGRVRIRTEALKDPDNMALVENFIKGQDGVIDIAANPTTGSLLVHYDPEKIPRDTLMAAAQALEAQLPQTKTPGTARKKIARKACMPFSRKTETALLVGLYGATLAGGFVSTRVHIAAASLFTVLAGLHVYNRRKCL